MLKRYYLASSMLIFSLSISAQDVWTLERCINHARENSRLVKQNGIMVKDAKLQNEQARGDRYPSVSAGSNLGFNFGRSVNPSTYQFENSQSTFNSWSLGANAVLYAGGRIENTIRQTEINRQAALADLEQAANNIGLQVASAYLQILLNDEQLENAKRRVQISQSQIERVDKQIRAGALPPNARLDIVAQLARDEQQVVVSQNNVDLSYLQLKNLLELAPEMDLRIQKPTVVVPNDVNPDAFMFKGIYNQALGNQPTIRAADLRIKSAEIGVKVAESALKPTLSVNANVNTNYSSTISDFANPDLAQARLVFASQGVPVKINGNDASLTTSRIDGITYPKISYGSQFVDNFGQGVNFNLQIPIFDGFSRKITIDRQKLNVQSQTLNLETSKQQLKTDIMNAIANAKASKKQYDAVLRTYEALKATFEATEKRFQIGAANGFEFSQARTNLVNAESDVTFAKYDYLFKIKIVEFYEGKKLTLK